MTNVTYEVRKDIALITINRPEVHNAIDRETDNALHDSWIRFADDDTARVAILTGAGDRAFCAGADLRSHVDPWLHAGPELGRSLLDTGFAGGITRGLHRLRKPVIAALNGWVIGGGIELALACDIRIAAEHARFGFFHIRRGMHFADGGIVRLVNTCGVGVAMELELTGDEVDAQRAKELHLVNRVVPADGLLDAASEVARKIIRNPRMAVESAKDTILEVIGRPLDDQLRLECLYGYATMGNPEIEERRVEFIEHGDPDRPS